MMQALLLSLVGGLPAAGMPSPGDPATYATRLRTESIVLTAKEVHVGDGTVHSPGTVVILDGKVVAVGPNPGLPLSSRVIACDDFTISPGLVDAACQVGTYTQNGFSEQSSEVIAHLSVKDSVNLDSRGLEQLAKEGVTTIYLTPEAASVIGSQGAVVKTGGHGVSRFLEAPASVKANLAEEAWSRGSRNQTPRGFGSTTFLTRRPTTRMGSNWVFRKAFYDAIRLRDTGEGGDSPEAALKTLVQVLDGSMGFRIQARRAHDVYAAQRHAEEFGYKHLIEYGIEAHLCLDLLAAHGTPVVYGPIFVRPTGATASERGAQSCLTTPAQLAERGIPFCLTACDGTGEAGLARQAGLAMRYGLTAEQAMKAVTSSAADLLGIGDQVGRLQSGKAADLVVWSGAPLEDTSKPLLVLVDGHVVLDLNGWMNDTDNNTSPD